MPPLTTSIDAVVFMTMGLILVLAAAPLGNAIGQQIDLNGFRWGLPRLKIDAARSKITPGDAGLSVLQ